MTAPSNEDPPRRTNYPIRCIVCGKKEMRPALVARDIQKNHDGRLYDLHIEDLPAVQCSACGETVFTLESDERISRALSDRLRMDADRAKALADVVADAQEQGMGY
jgi:YgiT-type zinc finger domain-containing protein